jgi:UMF1 family MFS transporter
MPGQKKITKEQWSWAFYDWANSAFATTVMAGFFPLFYKSYWASSFLAQESTAILGTINSIAGLIIMFLAPILGAYADIKNARKKMLRVFATLGIIATGALFFLPQGEWFIAAIFFIIGVIGFSGGNILYDSLILSVSTSKERNKVSSLGFSLGYLGGGLLFLGNVFMYLSPQSFGLSSNVEAVLWSFLSVALWWGIFSLPLFFYVQSDPVKNPIDFKPIKSSIVAFKNVLTTIRMVKSYKRPAIFLLAYWLYIDGVDTIIRMATAYGSDIGLDTSSMITALLLTQFIGFPSTLFFGVYANKLGFKKILSIGISIYILVCFYSAYMTTAKEFYILAATIGLVQGGIQAISRSFFSNLIPAEKASEFFGFYNLVGKSAVVFGPALVGWVALFFGNPRFGILSLLLLFIPGLILLWFVPEDEGI